LAYEDRRANYARFSEVFAKVKELRDTVEKEKNDNNATTNWQDDQQALNMLIITTDVSLDQIEDSQLDDVLFTRFI
jgi:hypothetical protein